MDIAGIDEIYAVGGAQAIAAFSYGTDQIQPVNLIVGPGNSFATEAKRQCYGKVGIDFVAGPSEVLVIADSNADPDIVAADLLAQSEHDKEAKGIVVTTDEGFGQAVIKAVEEQLEQLDTREIASRSWADFGEVLLADDLEEAIAYANSYAPEHLEVNVAETQLEQTVGALHNYGSLFIGGNTAEVFGDYASGTNHTLPTNGYAKAYSGVSLDSFIRKITFQEILPEGMKAIGPAIEEMAANELLDAHKNAVTVRLSSLK